MPVMKGANNQENSEVRSRFFNNFAGSRQLTSTLKATDFNEQLRVWGVPEHRDRPKNMQSRKKRGRGGCLAQSQLHASNAGNKKYAGGSGGVA